MIIRVDAAIMVGQLATFVLPEGYMKFVINAIVSVLQLSLLRKKVGCVSSFHQCTQDNTPIVT